MVCVRCGNNRTDISFYHDLSYPGNVCKSCIHRRQRPTRVGVERRVKTEVERTQAAVRYVVKHAQNGQPFVYLLGAPRKHCKIGVSTDVCKRMRQLATGSSVPVRLIAVAPGGRPLEQELHARFRGLRIHGEWFRDQQQIVAVFSKLPGAMVFLPGYLSANLPAA